MELVQEITNKNNLVLQIAWLAALTILAITFFAVYVKYLRFHPRARYFVSISIFIISVFSVMSASVYFNTVQTTNAQLEQSSILSLQVNQIDDSTVSIYWETDIPVYGYVEYQEAQGPFKTKLPVHSPSEKVKAHSIQISGLKKNTPYYFTIIMDGSRVSNGPTGKFVFVLK